MTVAVFVLLCCFFALLAGADLLPLAAPLAVRSCGDVRGPAVMQRRKSVENTARARRG